MPCATFCLPLQCMKCFDLATFHKIPGVILDPSDLFHMHQSLCGDLCGSLLAIRPYTLAVFNLQAEHASCCWSVYL